jgi:hypothetical protein
MGQSRRPGRSEKQSSGTDVIQCSKDLLTNGPVDLDEFIGWDCRWPICLECKV